MQELKDLIRVGLSGRITGIETFNQFTASKKSLTYKLFHHISEGKINTDAEAKALLYGDGYKGFKYNMLKERFKDKLYTNVLFVQPRKRDTRSYAHNAYYCHKYYIVAKLLLMIVAKNAGRNLMRKVLLRAQTYQVYEIALLAAIALRRQTLEQGNRKDFNIYVALNKNILALMQAENEAEEQNDALMMYFTTSYAARPELIEQAKKNCTYINKLKNIYNTYNLNQAYFHSQIFLFDLQNNYTATLAACNSFESYLLSQPNFYSPVRHGNLIIQKLNSYLYLEKYTEGLELAQKSANFHEAKEGNWLALKEMHFLLALRNSDYAQACEVYKEVNNMLYKNIDQRQKELWYFFSGYLWLCLSSDNLIGLRNEVFNKLKDFKLSKLLNEVPLYTKDKEGLNLSLGILQLALLLQGKEFDRVVDKIEHIKTYIHKYISRKSGARDHVMLKLALLLPKYNFEADVLEKKALPHLEKLKTLTSREQTYNRTHIEVIPYHLLWKIILRDLKSVVSKQ